MPDCEYCKHYYVNPCNGRDKECPNKLHLDQNKPKIERVKLKKKVGK